MKNMYNLLKCGGAGFIAYAILDGYRTAVINVNNIKETDRILQDVCKKYKLV